MKEVTNTSFAGVGSVDYSFPTIDLPPPPAFGFPERFGSWRPNQTHAITTVTDGQSRFYALVCPTGFGKSILYVAAAVLSGKRTVFLTSSKGLQSQLLRDFADLGMVDIRGRSNYRCLVSTDTSCDQGPCVVGMQCQYKENGQCPYYKALFAAARASLVVTNYSYWMSSNEHAGAPLGQFQMLVCDEGHGLPDIVSDHLTITLHKSDDLTKSVLPNPVPTNLDGWREWARSTYPRVNRELDKLSNEVKSTCADRWVRKTFIRTKMLSDNLRRIASMNDDWVVDVGQFDISFSPIWPAPYMEDILWLKVPKVVMTSATICPKTLGLVGLDSTGNDPNVVYREYPHSFPIHSRHIIHVPTVRMNYRMSDTDVRTWLTRIDQIIAPRHHRKGIVHTVSYQRRDLLLTRSRFAESFVTHKRQDAELQVRKFKASNPPSILVSPSMTTGWDFPYDECRWQIIGKLAYPDTRNKIMYARCNDDQDYGAYIAMQQLVQAAGRSTRAADDWSETFVIDDNIGWFMDRYGKAFAPGWFRQAYGKSQTLPQPRKEEGE